MKTTDPPNIHMLLCSFLSYSGPFKRKEHYYSMSERGVLYFQSWPKADWQIAKQTLLWGTEAVTPTFASRNDAGWPGLHSPNLNL